MSRPRFAAMGFAILLGSGACVPAATPPNPLKVRMHDVITGEELSTTLRIKRSDYGHCDDGDRVTVVGNLTGARASREINAQGLAVAPGFINMLSWANESLIEGGRAMSDIIQGVTLEVMGEGDSMGPLSDAMKRKRSNISSESRWQSQLGQADGGDRES